MTATANGKRSNKNNKPKTNNKMTWKSESTGDKKTYAPHPEGAFAAVCCDVFSMELPNKFYNTKSKFTGEMDMRQTITKVCISFLTSETIEIDGEKKPAYTSYWATLSWHEKANLRKFVGQWIRGAGDKDVFDEETLIGMTALVNVIQYDRNNGGKGHSVTTAMPLPKGMEAPGIPADFVRHKDKDREERPTVTTDPAAKYGKPAPQQVPDMDDDMPF